MRETNVATLPNREHVTISHVHARPAENSLTITTDAGTFTGPLSAHEGNLPMPGDAAVLRIRSGEVVGFDVVDGLLIGFSALDSSPVVLDQHSSLPLNLLGNLRPTSAR